MKAFKIFIAMLVLFLLERLFFARCFEIFSLTPWLMFTFCMLVATISDDAFPALVTAGISGFVSDVSGGGAMGTAMVSFVVSAFCVHFLTVRLFRDSLWVTLVSVFICSMLGELIYFALNSNGVAGFSFFGIWWSVALPLSAINTFFALLMYPVARRIFAERRYV